MLHKPPPLPSPWSLGVTRALVHANLGPPRRHGTAIVLLPRLAPFATPLDHLDDEGLRVAVKIKLPHAPKFVVVSVYAPCTEDKKLVCKEIIDGKASDLLLKYPNLIMGGDFKFRAPASLGHGRYGLTQQLGLAAKPSHPP